jgi:hypothetical protein
MALDFDLDARILTLALARMVDAVANSFLVVVLPLYIERVVDLPAFIGGTVSFGPVEFSLTSALLIGVVLSLFGFLNSLGSPSPAGSRTGPASGRSISSSGWRWSRSAAPATSSSPTTSRSWPCARCRVSGPRSPSR